MFIHDSYMHFWGNLFLGCIFGYFLELHLKFEWYKLCLIFLVSGWFADLLVLNLTHRVSCGASGAVSGLAGCYIVNLFTQYKVVLKDFMSYLLIAQACMLLVQEAVLFTSDPSQKKSNIGHGAHFGGMMAGVLLGIIFLDAKQCKCMSKTVILVLKIVVATLFVAFAGLLLIYFMVQKKGLFV